MNKIALSVAALMLSSTAGISAAADAEAGKAVFASKGCVGCHGADGISAVPTYPNLAGQKEQYLALSIKSYKDGTRNSTNAASMKPMAAMLSDADIENVAAYLAGLK